MFEGAVQTQQATSPDGVLADYTDGSAWRALCCGHDGSTILCPLFLYRDGTTTHQFAGRSCDAIYVSFGESLSMFCTMDLSN